MRRNGNRARARPKPFTLDEDTRRRLAEILRRHPNIRPSVQCAIDDLERHASDFVDRKLLAVTNRDVVTLRAALKLCRASTRELAAIEALPARARDLLDRVLQQRGEARVLARARETMRLLLYATERVRTDLARPTGRPSDRRGQGFAFEIALTLNMYGIPIAATKTGPLAGCLTVLFEAVDHPQGDLGTLLDAVVKAERRL